MNTLRDASSYCGSIRMGSEMLTRSRPESVTQSKPESVTWSKPESVTTVDIDPWWTKNGFLGWDASFAFCTIVYPSLHEGQLAHQPNKLCTHHADLNRDSCTSSSICVRDDVPYGMGPRLVPDFFSGSIRAFRYLDRFHAGAHVW